MNNILNVPHISTIIPVQRERQLELRCYAIPYGIPESGINIKKLLETHQGFQFVIIIDTDQHCCEGFSVKLNNSTDFKQCYNIISSNGVITQHSDSEKEHYTCSFVFGTELCIHIENYHNGFYPHRILILGPDDEEKFQTCL